MFPKPGRQHRYLASIALLAILLRVAVPAGYMPGSFTDGWYLQLCPHGMPVSAAALLGAEGHHHNHHDTGDSPQYAVDECNLGYSFTVAALLDALGLAIAFFLILYLSPGYSPLALSQACRRFFDSRAPPLVLTS